MKTIHNVCLLEAINFALSDAMNEDANVCVMGQDVGTMGGVFRATDGLLESYGAGRVIDMPLAESLIGGMAVGMAAQGLRPIAEFQFMGFFHAALEHIANHAARMRNRTRGRLTCPLVYRMPYGGGIHAPEHHSESLESILAHFPGLRIVTVNQPQQAYDLLRTAINSDDPVIFLEPKRLYRASTSPLTRRQPDAIHSIKACTLREGADLTLISWGAQIPLALEAANALAQAGIDVHVIDLVSLAPIDIAHLQNAVNQTGRALILHEAAKTCGLGAEITALITEHCFYSLLAPVARVTGYDTIMPYHQLELNYMPNLSRICLAARTLMSE